ncbi:MAG: hypothetical protein CMB72_04115 [Euryarchaeota archaeon]|nr:hypothetical protein [Euryarchaeota archaeon]|tara:strand:- start:3712 stop:4158 length:447 start_codon:yes stop_codon:yes gene_type:complete
MENKEREENAQVHMIEMITLFWLFFLCAAFVIQLQVPDTNPIASDAALLIAAEDAHSLASAETDSNGDSIIGSHLAADERHEACTLLIENLPDTVTGNCWLGVDAQAMERAGEGEIPPAQSLTVMHLHSIEGKIWTVGLQVWHIGSGA